jgi:glycosyltransferase involved in cell wall biosynthesis
MVIGLLWIFGIYGFCTACIHLLHWLGRGAYAGRDFEYAKRKTTYVVLITMNNQLQIEWYVRSYLMVSLLRGRLIDLTVFDAGSTDDTLLIVQKLALTRDNIKVEATTEGLEAFIEAHQDDQVVQLHLANRNLQEGWLRLRW